MGLLFTVANPSSEHLKNKEHIFLNRELFYFSNIN